MQENLPFDKSKFIWFENQSQKNTYGEFRGAFTVAGKQTIMRISCDGDYILYINGEYVASNQYGDFEHYKVYDEIDISQKFRAGENEYFIVVWHFGEDSQRYVRYMPGVIFEILSDGNIVAFSDKRVAARKSKAYFSGDFRHLSDQLGFSFSYDATKEENLDGFAPSVEISKQCEFFKRPIEKGVLGEFVMAKQIYESDSTRYVFDLGREYVGLCSFELEAAEPTQISVAYSEHLRDGFVPSKIGNRDFSFDYKAKAGANKFVGYMLRLACRYLEVISDSPIKIQSIGIIPQYYPAKVKPVKLESALDKAIYDACVRTLQLCMMEHYVDCPWREQCLYAFDSRNQMLCGYYAFEDGNTSYARENLRLISQSRRDDGLLPICSPCGLPFTIPSFSLHFVVAVYEYYMHTHDEAFVKEVLPRIEQILNSFVNNASGDALCKFKGKEHWNFYDWSAGANGRLFEDEAGGVDPMVNFLFIRAYKAYLSLCEVSGTDTKIAFDIERCIEAVREDFFDKEKGLWKMSDLYTELINSQAILSGASKGQEAELIAKSLADGALEECSLSMKCFKYDAMLSVSKETYRDVVLDEIRKTYTPMLETGTVWETAIGRDDFGNAGSLCHGWSAIPIYYYHTLA